MNRRPHPVFVWLYAIDQKDPTGPRAFHYNVSQEDIVKEMDRTARFKVGDAVQVGSFSARMILARKWNFERGMFAYRVEGARPDRNWTMDEDELERRIKGVTEEHA